MEAESCFGNKAINCKLLGNSAQHAITMGDELYVVFPLEKVFLSLYYLLNTKSQRKKKNI